MLKIYISDIQGRCGPAEGALSPSSVPFLPNLLRPSLLRPKYSSSLSDGLNCVQVKFYHLLGSFIFCCVLSKPVLFWRQERIIFQRCRTVAVGPPDRGRLLAP